MYSKHKQSVKTSKILAIETSCDETSIAVVEYSPTGIKPLSNVISSQIALHKGTFGVVPEVAARAHIKKLLAVTNKALKDSATPMAEIGYLAVTTGPGLITSLLVGTEFVKGLSLA